MNISIFEIGFRQSNKSNETHHKLWEYCAHEWKFGQTASLVIKNLKWPSYNKLSPPSNIKNEGGTMSEVNIGVAMYLWKEDMYIIHYTKFNDQANLLQAYGVTTGQCTDSLHAKLETKDIYK